MAASRLPMFTIVLLSPLIIDGTRIDGSRVATVLEKTGVATISKIGVPALEEEPVPKKLVPKAELWQKFENLMVKLTKDDIPSGFLDACEDADDQFKPDPGKKTVVSCGLTMDCFIKVFGDDPHVKSDLLSPPDDVDNALDTIGASESQRTDLQKLFPGGYGRYNKNVEWVGLLKEDIGRKFMRQVQKEALTRLWNELVRQDDGNLPRIFIPYMEWDLLDISTERKKRKKRKNQLDKSLEPAWHKWQSHTFAIIKTRNTNGNRFHIIQGYMSGPKQREKGYGLTGWLCSTNPFAAIDGFDEKLLSDFFDKLGKFVDNGVKLPEELAGFDSQNHALMFEARESEWSGQGQTRVQYLPFFIWAEIVGDPTERELHKMLPPEPDANRSGYDKCVKKTRLNAWGWFT